MAAAVADFTPKNPAPEKLKKGRTARFTLELTPTADILAEVGARRKRSRRPRVLVGFAAETGNPLAEARKKLASKGLDLVVANDVTVPGAGFEVATNHVVLVDASAAETLSLMSKEDVAEAVLDRVVQLLAS
jgi:phosphopantothenoylcysteine decarboxylase/phosphopantothenate--cysteine ligase